LALERKYSLSFYVDEGVVKWEVNWPTKEERTDDEAQVFYELYSVVTSTTFPELLREATMRAGESAGEVDFAKTLCDFIPTQNLSRWGPDKPYITPLAYQSYMGS
jgi:hypothetical protein